MSAFRSEIDYVIGGFDHIHVMFDRQHGVPRVDQTVSCDRLPQRIAARIELSFLTCSTNTSSAAANLC